MLVPLRPILESADAHRYAQGAFNVNAVSQVRAAIDMHETFRSPALLQGADLANGFMGGRTDFMNATLEDKRKGARNIAAAVALYGKDSPVPVALHLDHGRDFDSCVAAIDGGYTSVMIDGSSLPLAENIELTREVVKYAHERGVTVEGEIGVLAGVEDHIFGERSSYTNPLDAVVFVRKTKVDCLAISYGTMHGATKGKNVNLRKEIVTATKECLRHEGLFCVLVSHGSSTVPQYIVSEINALGGAIENAHGIPIAEITEAIRCGIGKVNVDTDIRLAVTRNLRELFADNPALLNSQSIGSVYRLLAEKPSAFDPREFLSPVMETVMYGLEEDVDIQRLNEAIVRGVREVIGVLLVAFGSYGKAPLVERVTLEDMRMHYRKNGI